MNMASPCKGWLSDFALTNNLLREIFSCTRQIQNHAVLHTEFYSVPQVTVRT